MNQLMRISETGVENDGNTIYSQNCNEKNMFAQILT